MPPPQSYGKVTEMWSFSNMSGEPEKRSQRDGLEMRRDRRPRRTIRDFRIVAAGLHTCSGVARAFAFVTCWLARAAARRAIRLITMAMIIITAMVATSCGLLGEPHRRALRIAVRRLRLRRENYPVIRARLDFDARHVVDRLMAPESHIASALAVILAAISSKCQGRKS